MSLSLFPPLLSSSIVSYRPQFLRGHSDEITAITFDRWHIVTASKDGYTLIWSAVGQHALCLSALRHPKWGFSIELPWEWVQMTMVLLHPCRAVLCAELQYLRVITGAEDGRLRIWNLLTGRCCRIMRGNSRSDPLKQICAIGDRWGLSLVLRESICEVWED